MSEGGGVLVILTDVPRPRTIASLFLQSRVKGVLSSENVACGCKTKCGERRYVGSILVLLDDGSRITRLGAVRTRTIFSWAVYCTFEFACS